LLRHLREIKFFKQVINAILAGRRTQGWTFWMAEYEKYPQTRTIHSQHRISFLGQEDWWHGSEGNRKDRRPRRYSGPSANTTEWIGLLATLPDLSTVHGVKLVYAHPTPAHSFKTAVNNTSKSHFQPTQLSINYQGLENYSSFWRSM
jgi:hypothetical protein